MKFTYFFNFFNHEFLYFDKIILEFQSLNVKLAHHISFYLVLIFFIILELLFTKFCYYQFTVAKIYLFLLDIVFILFNKEWICIGRCDEIPMSGDFITHEIAGTPILVVRQKSGEIKSFVNACAHRFTWLGLEFQVPNMPS